MAVRKITRQLTEAQMRYIGDHRTWLKYQKALCSEPGFVVLQSGPIDPAVEARNEIIRKRVAREVGYDSLEYWSD